MDNRREVQGAINYLKGQYFHFSPEWVAECVEFYLTENQGNITELNKFVKEQWLLMDLRTFKTPCLPANLVDQGRITLPGKYILQMQSKLDISVSCYSQWQQIKKVDQTNVEVREEPTAFRLPKSNRMFRLELTDGIQTIHGVEEEPIGALSADMYPGCKILIIGPVRCAKGRLRLTARNIEVLGGETDSLMVVNATENIIARKLGLPENPDPHNLRPPEVKRDNTTVNNTVSSIQQWDDDGLLDAALEEQLQAVEGDNFPSHNNQQHNYRNIPQKQATNILPTEKREKFKYYNQNIVEQRGIKPNVAERKPNSDNAKNNNLSEPILISDDEDAIDDDFLQSIDELEMKATAMEAHSRRIPMNPAARIINAPHTSDNKQVIPSWKSSSNQVDSTSKEIRPTTSHVPSSKPSTSTACANKFQQEITSANETTRNSNQHSLPHSHKTVLQSLQITSNKVETQDPQTSNHEIKRKNAKQTTLQFQKLDFSSSEARMNPKPLPSAVHQIPEAGNSSTADHLKQEQIEHEWPSMEANESLHIDPIMDLVEPKCAPFYFETNSTNPPEDPIKPVAPPLMMNSRPWVYLSQLKDLQLTTKSQFHIVNAVILKSITTVQMSDDAYHLEVLISDGTANLHVALSSDILEKFLGFSPAEIDKMMLVVDTNPLTKETLQKAFSKARQTIIDLDCLMRIEFNSNNALPIVVKVTDVTEQHYTELCKRLDSLPGVEKAN